MSDKRKLVFDSGNRGLWLYSIVKYRNLCNTEAATPVVLSFPDMRTTALTPIHIVSLACLIEHLFRHGLSVRIENTELGRHLYETLKFKEYWKGQTDYSPVADENILNLWRLKDEQKDIYGIEVTKYLKEKFKSDKDLSAVSLSITEAFYNVCDHAHADNNAFSFINFDPSKLILQIAVCDFGIGIGNSVRTVISDATDQEALLKAIEPKFTVKSKLYNSGMGLDSIRASSYDENMVIISNSALLVTKGDAVKTRDLGFEFGGTLVYYKINLNHYEESDQTLDSLDFDYL